MRATGVERDGFFHVFCLASPSGGKYLLKNFDCKRTNQQNFVRIYPEVVKELTKTGSKR